MYNAQKATTETQPFIAADKNLPEITVKAVILAIIVTAILGASNVYLALKLGQTVAASIPAAVLAMGVLRFFRNTNVLENNIVQTAASAGEGVAAAISFVLPALIIMGYWSQFHYWGTFCLTVVGGVLGVLFSIPLRRVMLNYPTLSFPEGTAIGNVLKASASGSTKMRSMLQGGFVGALISLLQAGLKVFSDNLQLWSNLGGKAIFGIGLGFSPALIAAGYIVGVQASISMLLGLILGWLIGMPILTHIYGIPGADSVYDSAMNMWSHHIRFIGVGTMLLGGAWTLVTLLKPIFKGIVTSFQSLRTARESHKNGIITPRTERDLPINYVIWASLILCVLAFFTCFYFLNSDSGGISQHMIYGVSIFGALYILIGGFFIASVCAYLSGLVGMTNNPLSGLLLGSVLLTSLILLPFFKEYIAHDAAAAKSAISIVIIITTIVATVIAISGENLQDLKAGQMVGATPWKQQVMLLLGVVVAAFVVGPVLELLFQAYGMGGVFPRSGMDPSQMLPAPQAGLMTAVAQGVFGHHLPWPEIITGVIIAFFAIICDEILKRKNLRLPVLAIGIGIYLPPEIITPVVVGGFVNLLAKHALQRRYRAIEDQAKIRLAFSNGTLLACGLVAGAALMGVLLAIPFVLKGSSDALSVVSAGFKPIAEILGLLVTIGLCVWLYKTTRYEENSQA
jgi:putative OPT family oligopeptide transporter